MQHDSQGGVTPDTAMMSGSDDGEPGEHLAEPPLTSDEMALLENLQHGEPRVVTAVEDSPMTVTAVQDETAIPLPASTQQQEDGLAPPFEEPPD
jgi:hypothetical protein